VRATVLVDAGPIVALVDSADPWHSLCREAIAHLPLPLLTSEAVLTEALHFAARTCAGMEAAWSFIHSSIILATIGEAALQELHFLMSQYSDRPMDFADATLVYLARRESLTTVFTIDHNDFETYRIRGRQGFRIVPGRLP
jgi:predicted nucleic acid-binding protein